jgi:hypothetical protein
MLGANVSGRMTAREAVRAGVFDFACCERRGKIELRTWLDRLQRHPRKRAASWRSWFVDAEAGFAAERRAFRAAVRDGIAPSDAPPVGRSLRSVGLVGVNSTTRLLAAEFAMRGVSVVWVEGNTADLFAEALRRGRLTPLEAEQAAKRVRMTHDADALTACDWVTLADPHADLAGMLERDLPPRAILCVPPVHLDRATTLALRPQRVLGLRMQGETAAITDGDADGVATVAGWLGVIGVPTATRELAPVAAFV